MVKTKVSRCLRVSAETFYVVSESGAAARVSGRLSAGGVWGHVSSLLRPEESAAASVSSNKTSFLAHFRICIFSS